MERIKYFFDFSDRQFRGLNFREKLTIFICRIKGHPNGVTWYNLGGFEPDMTCKDCGEDLG